MSRWSVPVVDDEAPPERLAAFRIVFGVLVVGYLGFQFPRLWALAERSALEWQPIGVLGLLDAPPPADVWRLAVCSTLVAGVASAVGALRPVGGPVLGVGLLVVATGHSSWGTRLHFEHLLVLHGLVLAFAPSADAWSVDAWWRARRGRRPLRRSPHAYGWPLGLAAMVTVVTYVVAGVAKLRYGGAAWFSADTLANHVAYAAVRSELLGADAAPLAELVVGLGSVLGIVAVVVVVLELGAPLALLGGRVRDVWVGAAWSMHVGIALTMWIGFPSQLWGVAFAPLYALERPVERLVGRLSSTVPPGSSRRDRS